MINKAKRYCWSSALLCFSSFIKLSIVWPLQTELNWTFNARDSFQLYTRVSEISTATRDTWLDSWREPITIFTTRAKIEDFLMDSKIAVTSCCMQEPCTRKKLRMHQNTPFWYFTTHGHSYYGRRIGSRIQAFEYNLIQWLWVTLNPDFKVTLLFNVK